MPTIFESLKRWQGTPWSHNGALFPQNSCTYIGYGYCTYIIAFILTCWSELKEAENRQNGQQYNALEIPSRPLHVHTMSLIGAQLQSWHCCDMATFIKRTVRTCSPYYWLKNTIIRGNIDGADSSTKVEVVLTASTTSLYLFAAHIQLTIWFQK